MSERRKIRATFSNGWSYDRKTTMALTHAWLVVIRHPSNNKDRVVKGFSGSYEKAEGHLRRIIHVNTVRPMRGYSASLYHNKEFIPAAIVFSEVVAVSQPVGP